MELEHIINGEPYETVREKLNRIIDAYNETFPVTRSYLDLTDKPAIDGRLLLPDTSMASIPIPVESLPEEINIQQLFVSAARSQAEAIAREVAEAEVEKAMQLENIPNATVLPSDDWEILVYIKQPNDTLGLYKTTLKWIIDKATAAFATIDIGK